MNRPDDRTTFLLKNLLKGVIWFAVILGVFFVAKSYLGWEFDDLLAPVYEKPLLVFSVFSLSEAVFGIIPPELFMFWSLRKGLASDYVANIAILSTLSYGAGVLGFYIGRRFNKTEWYQKLEENLLDQFKKQFIKYGGFLIVVAALTPLPFSGICMLTGAIKYPAKSFLVISITRFIRFGAYAYIIWKANIIRM